MTPEQQLLLPELEAHNASITRSNEAAAAHNALLPPEVEPVPIRPLLTLTEYVQYKLDQAAEAEARKVQAASKTNEQWQAEWTASKNQLDAVEADKESIEAARLQLVSDLATANADKDSLTTQVATLTSQLQEVTESKDVLFVKKQAVDHDLVEANAKIAFLESIRQYNPRWTTPDYFINRFTAKEAKAFYSSEDAMIVGGQQLLEAYEAAGWYVDLDDTQVQGLTGYMVQLGMMSPERRAQVLRDVSAQEAWYPQ